MPSLTLLPSSNKKIVNFPAASLTSHARPDSICPDLIEPDMILMAHRDEKPSLGCIVRRVESEGGARLRGAQTAK